MSAERDKIIVLVGPTGVGKTGVAIEVAKELGGEIVNADSMQVYRYMDVGTAKPTARERAAVPHHLLDILDPDEDFDAFIYAEMARAAIAEIRQRDRLAVVVGGTGLYLKSLLYGLFPGAAKDAEVRQRLRKEAADKGDTFLYQRLQEVDPETARRLNPRDLVRVVRALEVWECTGTPISKLQKEHGFSQSMYRALKIGLHLPRNELYARIERRADEMLTAGLVAEVQDLLQRGYGPELKSMQALGYRHMVRVVKGEMVLEKAVDSMKRDTRRYAKRQLTWFRQDQEIHWFTPAEKDSIVRLAREYLES
ncbi:MAG: tRNA (adenosine(37)-N6)-dimethylallyltransferase MiaA [Deltaproteobacteria bacterium]|nr:tRNA (adenosine(37)-N6)-dimethylallyltransferase MiaA [Deltaproteobacteria bacterium]